MVTRWGSELVLIGTRPPGSSWAETWNRRAPSLTCSPTAAPTVVHGARERRPEGELHLHRLEHAEPLPLLDRVTLDHVDGQQGAGHRGGQAALTGAGPVGRERVGPLEDEALTLEDDLDGVGGRVDDRLHATSVDVEAYDVEGGVQLRHRDAVDRALGAVDEHDAVELDPGRGGRRRPAGTRRSGTGRRARTRPRASPAPRPRPCAGGRRRALARGRDRARRCRWSRRGTPRRPPARAGSRRWW